MADAMNAGSESNFTTRGDEFQVIGHIAKWTKNPT